MTNVRLGTVTRCAHTTVYSKDHSYKKDPKRYAVLVISYSEEDGRHEREVTVQEGNGYGYSMKYLEQKVALAVRRWKKYDGVENIEVKYFEENE